MYGGSFYLLSVFHVIDYADLVLAMETNLPPKANTVPVAYLVGFIYYDLLKVGEETNAEALL